MINILKSPVSRVFLCLLFGLPVQNDKLNKKPIQGDPMTVAINSTFSVPVQNEEFIILVDHDKGASVTNDAENVIRWLDENLAGGLGQRKVYYRDTMGEYDELEHENVNFKGYIACPRHIKQALAEMVQKAMSEGK
ncbi:MULTISPECIES: hypothetical protein [Enterobacteriaceae]|nr:MULTISPECIES: hypothetical protein [Enterobacteriaceae]ELK0756148.1 hypothetical protein [Klebsiella oxytoca]HDU3837890.1 hypothetical protein [Klebsiella pneumoniae subsp. pneumoniae]RDT14091.1 hypothetical protein DXF84_10510 [Escherichia coli]RXK65156.1 hypothetical protein ET141_27465 [Klebsiella pneumoniae]HBX5762328.1 hypothetical protein [Klebsiella pneumoniae]